MTASFRNKRFWAYSAALLVLTFLLWPGAPGMNGGGIVSHWGKLGLSPSTLEDAELLCSGHFSQQWEPFNGTSHVMLTSEHRCVHALRKIISFHVDHYWKGNGPAEIKIALFQPTEGAWHWIWMLPAKENLLLALKKDATGSGANQLVNQTNSWLVIRGNTKPETTEISPEKEIARVANDYLAAYASGTEETKQIVSMEPLRIGSLLPGELLIDNNFVVGQTLATVGAFQLNDEPTIALLKKLLTTPMSPPIYDEAIRALMKIAPVEGWNFGYQLYESKSTDEQEEVVLSMALPSGITTKTFSRLDLAKIETLMQVSPRLMQDISSALRAVKDPLALPLFEKLMADSDEHVRYAGMDGVYGICGGRGEGFVFPAYEIYQSDPEKYLAPYKAWCAQQRLENTASGSSGN